jgi:hypothetical protein
MIDVVINDPYMVENQEPVEDTGHVEGVLEDVMFGQQDQHEVEGTGDPKRPTITERTLADGEGQDHGRWRRQQPRREKATKNPERLVEKDQPV